MNITKPELVKHDTKSGEMMYERVEKYIIVCFPNLEIFIQIEAPGAKTRFWGGASFQKI